MLSARPHSTSTAILSDGLSGCEATLRPPRPVSSQCAQEVLNLNVPWHTMRSEQHMLTLQAALARR